MLSRERRSRWYSIAKRWDSSRTRWSSSIPRLLGASWIGFARPGRKIRSALSPPPRFTRSDGESSSRSFEMPRVSTREARVREGRHHDAELPAPAVDHQQIRQRLARHPLEPPVEHLAHARVVVPRRRLAHAVAPIVLGQRLAVLEHDAAPHRERPLQIRDVVTLDPYGPHARARSARRSSSIAVSTLSRAASREASESDALRSAISTSRRPRAALRAADLDRLIEALAPEQDQRAVVVVLDRGQDFARRSVPRARAVELAEEGAHDLAVVELDVREREAPAPRSRVPRARGAPGRRPRPPARASANTSRSTPPSVTICCPSIVRSTACDPVAQARRVLVALLGGGRLHLAARSSRPAPASARAGRAPSRAPALRTPLSS